MSSCRRRAPVVGASSLSARGARLVTNPGCSRPLSHQRSPKWVTDLPRSGRLPRPRDSTSSRGRESGEPGSRPADRAEFATMATTEEPQGTTGTDAWREELYEAVPERQGELFSTMSGIENP